MKRDIFSANQQNRRKSKMEEMHYFTVSDKETAGLIMNTELVGLYAVVSGTKKLVIADRYIDADCPEPAVCGGQEDAGILAVAVLQAVAGDLVDAIEDDYDLYDCFGGTISEAHQKAVRKYRAMMTCPDGRRKLHDRIAEALEDEEHGQSHERIILLKAEQLIEELDSSL
jgi:hypothetical protein